MVISLDAGQMNKRVFVHTARAIGHLVLRLAQIFVEQSAPNKIKSICSIIFVVLHLVMRDVPEVIYCIARNDQNGAVERLLEIVGQPVDTGGTLPF